MKNLKIIIFLLFFCNSVFAQEKKVTNENILGKWRIVKLEIPNQITADAEKDKITFAKALEQELKKNPESFATAENLYKGMLQSLKASYMQFNPDGNYVGVGINGTVKGKYTLDTEKQKLTITGKTTAGNINNSNIVFEKDGKLKITQLSSKSDGKITAILTLKK